MDFLRIYNIKNYQKIRIGDKKDGGYVVLDGFNYDCFISCGVGDNVSFEIDFLNKYNIPNFCFDGTVEKLPVDNQKINFIKKNIGFNENEENLLNISDNYKNIFLKMDIEKAEYDWILNTNNLKNYKQIVIEFHQPFKEDIEKRISAIKKLSQTHYFYHIHANNCCGTRKYKGFTVPNIFEISMIRKGKFKVLPNQELFPTILDYPNVEGREEIKLEGYPYQW